MYLVGSYAVKHITFHLHSTYRQQALEHRKIKHFREYTFSHHALITFSFQKVQNVMSLDRYKKAFQNFYLSLEKLDSISLGYWLLNHKNKLMPFLTKSFH